MDLGSLGKVVLVFGVGIIIASITVDIVSNIKSGQTANSAAYNTSAKGEEGILKVANYFPTIGLVVAAVILIGLLIRSFGGTFSSSGL